eukprot:1406297-Heterocapsa_arctica.AAC.1
MHKVPIHLAQKVDQQDVMVEELLTMMLDVMSHVHDKAPVRKKEDKQAQKEVQRKYQGPKTGPHGEHDFIDKEGGGCAKPKSKPVETSGRDPFTVGSGRKELQIRSTRETTRRTTNPLGWRRTGSLSGYALSAGRWPSAQRTSELRARGARP